MKEQRIIFYHPVPLDEASTSASGVRPLKVLRALEAAGYQIDLVNGYSKERAQAFRKIRSNLRNGVHYEFVYGETSTMPSELTDPRHLPLRPLLDYRFLRFCRRNKIPVGIFYRDIYWCFPGYHTKVTWLKRIVAIQFYKFDLFQYKRLATKIFLPSMEMARYIPGSAEKLLFSALPPAHDVKLDIEVRIKSPCSLLYVGGIGDHYGLKKLIEAVSVDQTWNLTLCTRKQEWDREKKGLLDGRNLDNLRIEHRFGEGLKALYDEHRLAMMFVEPVPYWTFAVPYKLFEYLGNCIPIVATDGTLAGEMVKKLDIGWCIEYSTPALLKLLKLIGDNPEMVDEKIKNIRSIRHLHTWDQRIQEIEQVLGARFQ